jgi:hypothetical protein
MHSGYSRRNKFGAEAQTSGETHDDAFLSVPQRLE